MLISTLTRSGPSSTKGSISTSSRGISLTHRLNVHHSCSRQVHLRKLHVKDPLSQADQISAGSSFASKHAEAIFVSGHSPQVLRPRIDAIRKLAEQEGRDPRSIKFFATFTPILGKTDEEAGEKLAELQKYASVKGGLVLFSGWTGIDISQIPLDQEITAADSKEANKVTSVLNAFTTTSKEVPKWTPRVVAEKVGIGGLGPVGVGSPATVADEMQHWVREADVDGFNIGYVTTPGTFEDVVELLIPELRRRGVYPEKRAKEGLTAREKVYGAGQAGLRADHTGSRYKYDVYKEDDPYVAQEEQPATPEKHDDHTTPNVLLEKGKVTVNASEVVA
jgi:hypothetical protein